MLKEMEELEVIRQLEMEQIGKIKNELEELEIRKIDEFEKLDENLRINMLRSRFIGRTNNIEEK